MGGRWSPAFSSAAAAAAAGAPTASHALRTSVEMSLNAPPLSSAADGPPPQLGVDGSSGGALALCGPVDAVLDRI